MTKNSDSKAVCPKCGDSISTDAPQGLCPKCVMSVVATESDGGLPLVGTGDVPTLERVGQAFPNLEVIELIGRGGMGLVFKARQPNLDRFVALKLLTDKLAKDPRFAERFNREGKVLARLNHPNIVNVYDFGRTDDFYFLMMEYVEGVNLRQAMRAGRFSPTEALTVVPSICEALQYAHDQGILHRDIKPENILLDTKGNVKIADFGIAKLVGDDNLGNVTLTNTGSALGTPHYMAPEQLENPSEVDHRADIYSLGVVLYEMLTGELPISRFDAPSAKTPVGKGVDDVVFRALEKNREKRQHSANEFKTQVQTAGAGEVPPKPASRQESESKVCDVAAVGTLLVGLSLVNIVVGMFIHFLMKVPVGSASFFFPVVVPFLAMSIMGTVLGWVGLVKIKRSGGELYGTPIALFAALTYPIALPALVIVALPMVIKFQAGAGPGWIARMTIFALIAGLLSALIWSAVAICRWAYNRPRGEHWNSRGWAITSGAIFVPLLLIALGNTGGPKINSMNSGRSSDPIVSRISTAEQLPHGIVQLVALSTHPSDGIWWKPEGSPWTEAPFTNPGHNADSRAEHRAVEMVFRTPGVDDPYPAYKFRLEGSRGSSGGSPVIQNGEPVDNSYFTAALFPKDMTETTVAVGVAFGHWETLADEPSGSQASLSMVRRGVPVSINFVSVEENAKRDTVLVVAHDIKDAQLQLVAVDAEGKETREVERTTSGSQATATFAGLSLENIRRFRLKVRSFRWAVFENVQLEPRVLTGDYPGAVRPGVVVDFSKVTLRSVDGVARLELHYTTYPTSTKSESSTRLEWKTDGRFRDAPVSVLESSSIIAGARSGQTNVYRNIVALELPKDIDSRDVGIALTHARDRWEGNHLIVHAGDEYPILTVKQLPENEVSLSLTMRPME